MRKTIFTSVVVLLLLLLGAWWYFGFSLDFMQFFAAEPGVTDTTGTTTDSGGQPVPEGCQSSGTSVVCQRVSCVAEKTTVSVGATVNIQAYGGSGGYVFMAPEGVIDPAGSGGLNNIAGVRYDIPGMKQVLVTSKRAADSALTDVAACPIIVIPAAVTN